MLGEGKTEKVFSFFFSREDLPLSKAITNSLSHSLKNISLFKSKWNHFNKLEEGSYSLVLLWTSSNQVLKIFALDLELWFYVSFRQKEELNLPNLHECSTYWFIGRKGAIISFHVLLKARSVRDAPSLSTRLTGTGRWSPQETVDLDRHVNKSGYQKLRHF